jgi:hypothetical protein
LRWEVESGRFVRRGKQPAAFEFSGGRAILTYAKTRGKNGRENGMVEVSQRTKGKRAVVPGQAGTRVEQRNRIGTNLGTKF